MTARLFYVDESWNSSKFCLSAIGIRHIEWRECFSRVQQHRALLREDFGISVRKELHAHALVGGRGRLSKSIIGKYQRSKIFEGLLKLVSQLPEVMIINVCLDCASHKDVQMDAWDRLMNRIERTMLEFENRETAWRQEIIGAIPATVPEQLRNRLETRLTAYRPVALVVADQGREREITAALRRMSRFNYIPSAFGAWGPGQKTKNIPIQRVVEDPIFKDSKRSYFIQLADSIAFALLKRESAPTPNVTKYGLNEMFERTIKGVCYLKASSDPLGIVRK